MLYLIAILTAFFGGLLGKAFAFRNVRHRFICFSVPILLSTALLHIPMLMETLQAGFPPRTWEVLRGWTEFQVVILLVATLLTGIGWFCSYCIQSVFED